MPNTNSLFAAETIDVDKLIRLDPLLVIPVYQRSFAWDEKHVYALIEDILEGIEKYYSDLENMDQMTYIGTIIYTNGDKTLRDLGIQSVGSRSWLVIDGQQRLTTISIIALSLAFRLAVINQELIAELIKRTPPIPSVDTLRHELEKTISSLVRVFEVNNGEGSCIPRIIRLATDDSTNRYNSSLSFLIYSALLSHRKSELHRFKPRDPQNHVGKNHERRRFESLEKEIGNFIYSRKECVFDNLPKFEVLKDKWESTSQFLSERIQKEAFKDADLQADQVSSLENAYRLCVFGRYFLSRVAMTTVHGENEGLAYDVFDSLNTSGEPLNAYETFKPYVLRRLNLRSAEYAAANTTFQQIEAVAQGPKTIGKRQKLYSNTVILYSLTELGQRVGKKLADQHSALRKCYDQAVIKQESLDSLRTTIQIATAFDEPEVALKQGKFLPSLDEEAKVCFKFLSDINHSIALPSITRFFYEYERGVLSKDDLSDAVKAVTAFAVLWRAPRGGTAGVDSEFRQLMEYGLPAQGVLPLARSKDLQTLSLERLKRALKSRLEFARDTTRYGSLVTKGLWVTRVAHQKLYDTSKKLTKLLLLAAQHDAVADPSAPGLIIVGNSGVANSFTLSMYTSEQTYSIEHVAPQNDRAQYGWSRTFDSTLDCVHWIGNLLLMPLNSNSMLHNRSWDVKRKVYKVLSCRTVNERQELLADPALSFLTSSSREQIINAEYMAPLDAISRVEEEWNLDIVKRRSERLLELAYDKFYGWLEST